MKEYKITRKKQLNAFSFMYYVAIFIITVLAYYQYYKELDNELLSYYIILFLISLAPVLFLHIEYLLRNGNYMFIIDSDNKYLRLSNTIKGEETIIYFDDIEQIVIYCAPSVRMKKNFKILPFENYHFGRIITNNRKQYIITNLLMEDIVDGFMIVPNIKVNFKFRIFATALF